MATKQYKTPGVYIQEPNSFPPSIVGVETAVPCFIGYTERAADSDGRSLYMIPKRIESMAEFVQYFGQGYPELYYLVKDTAPGAAMKFDVPETDQDWGAISLDGANVYHLAERGSASFNLYNSMRLFYANGGGSCYVISCDTYGGRTPPPKVAASAIEPALEVCKAFIGPTMVVVPDAVLLEDADYAKIAQQMLKTCAEAGDRMAIIDIQGAVSLIPPAKPDGKPLDWKPLIAKFRDTIKSGTNPEQWRYGAAYFPPLVTSVVAADEISIANFAAGEDEIKVLKEALTFALVAAYPPAPAPLLADKPEGAEKPPETQPLQPPVPALTAKAKEIQTAYVNKLNVADLRKNDAAALVEHKQVTQSLVATVPGFRQLLAAVAATQGVLPPSGAIAGVWTANDTLRGVWNAPANTGIATMIRPLLPINEQQQEDLNVPVQGLAVNAIRTFQGRGSLIWGARTLDSNSNDWRYIQVRRTMIYVEQSVKQALEAMVFKPNTAQTWVTVVAMIESFLHGLWSAGGLMGGSPAEAYRVQAGLGSTMTPQDVLEGVMRVHITLQMVHPAEFIELTFKQQMLGGS